MTNTGHLISEHLAQPYCPELWKPRVALEDRVTLGVIANTVTTSPNTSSLLYNFSYP